jgi:hypothetical protein
VVVHEVFWCVLQSVSCYGLSLNHPTFGGGTKKLFAMMIIASPRLVFDLKIGIMSRLEAQIFCFEKIYLKHELR